MAQVQFKRGTATNFNSVDPKDPGTMYVVGNVTAYDTGSGPDLSPTPGDYCEMFLGGNLIGVGHLATKKRPGLIPKLPANNQADYWLQATADGPQWANLSAAIGLDDVLVRHRDQNIYSEKSVLGNDFDLVGIVKYDSEDDAADETSTHLKLYTYPGLASFLSDNDHGSGYWTDSPNILFKGFRYNEDFLDQTCITDYTRVPSSNFGQWSSASYSIGKRLDSKVANTNGKADIANPEGEKDYIYLESEISRFAESSAPIKNTIITVSSPNGADILKTPGDDRYDLFNHITIGGTTVTPISGDLQQNLRISPVIHITNSSGVDTVTIGGDSGQVEAKSFKLDSVSGTDNTKWIRADGSTSAGGLFSQTDPGIVPAYGTGYEGDVFDMILTAGGWNEIPGLENLVPQNIMYTNTDQTVSGKKTYSQNQEITSTSTQKALILRNGSATSTTAYGNTPAIIFAQGKSIFDGSSPGNYPDWKVFGYSNSVNGANLKIQTTKTSSTWSDFITLYAKYGSTTLGISADGSYVQLGTSTAHVSTETYGDIKLISPETEGQTPAIDFFRDTDTAEDILNWKMYAANNGVLHIAPYLQGGSLGSNERVVVRIDPIGNTIPQLIVGSVYMGRYERSGTGIDYPGTYSFASDAGGIYIDIGDIVANEGSVYADRGGSVVVKYDANGGVKSPRFYVTDSDNANATSSPDTFIRANGGGFGGAYTWDSQNDEGVPGLVPGGADDDTLFLQSSGEWANPLENFSAENVTASYLDQNSAGYYPLLILGESSPEDLVENAELKYQATYSSGSYSYELKADKGGNLVANTVTASAGLTVTAVGATITGGVTAPTGNIVATAGNFVATAGHYYWGTNTPVCEWQDF